jgi:hypothetical protein
MEDIPKCPKGHDLTPENSFIVRDRPQCKLCRSQSQKGKPKGDQAERSIFKDLKHVYKTHGKKPYKDTPQQAKLRTLFEDEPVKFLEQYKKWSEDNRKQPVAGALDPGTAQAVEEAESVIAELTGAV